MISTVTASTVSTITTATLVGPVALIGVLVLLVLLVQKELAIVMDVFTRAIRGWNLSRLLDTGLTLIALQQGLSIATPAIHHSDQGIQYAAPAYVQVLEQNGIQISMASVGKPEENGYAERLIRTIKEEEVELSEYRDFAEAYHQIGRFIEDVYLHKRIHSALGYLTPAEFELAWRLALTQPVEGTP